MFTGMVCQEEVDRYSHKAINQALQGSWIKPNFVVNGHLNKELKFSAHIASDVSCHPDIAIRSNSMCRLSS